MKVMEKEYDFKEIIKFPLKLYYKYIEGYHIVLASEYPNWLVLNNNEYKMFSYIKNGLSIGEALEQYYEDVCQNEDTCIKVMTNLLTQIDDVKFFKDAEILPEDPIDTIKKRVHIGTTNGCNMHCEHCFMSAGTMPLETINLEKTIQLIKKLNEKYGELEVVVSGGEPLTYKYLEELLEGIKGNHVILFTNGSLISEKNIKMIAENCKEVQISFEGISKEYYEKVRGLKKYDKVINAINLLKKNDIRIVLAITILPNTLEDVKNNLIKFIEKLDYNNLEVRINDEIEMSGNALYMDMSLYNRNKSKESVINLIKKLDSMGYSVKYNDIRNVRITNCGIGTNIVINYDGKIYPCNKFSEYNFDSEIEVCKIIEEFNKINIETSNNFIKKCQSCELRYICSGGCRIDNLIKTGSMSNVICDNNYKEKIYRQLLDDYKMYREELI